MALTARDLSMATHYRSDFQFVSEAIRRAALGNGRQLQLVSETIRKAALGNGRQLQFASETIRKAALGNGRQLQFASETIRRAALANHGQLQAFSETLRNVVAEAARSHLQDVAQESTLPRQEVPYESLPIQPYQRHQLPIAQLFLHATFTVLVACVVIAYIEAKLANEPEESLLNLLFALWFWYEVHSEFWHGPE